MPRAALPPAFLRADRAETIRIMADPTAVPEDLVQPGHVFPLRARPGGVLQRAGHTEAAVDLAEIAGCRPIGILCEILNDDGTMARLPQLFKFAKKHKLRICTIEDLIQFRRTREKLVERVETVNMPTDYGEFVLHLYRSKSTASITWRWCAGNIAGNITSSSASTVNASLAMFLALAGVIAGRNCIRPCARLLKPDWERSCICGRKGAASALPQDQSLQIADRAAADRRRGLPQLRAERRDLRDRRGTPRRDRHEGAGPPPGGPRRADPVQPPARATRDPAGGPHCVRRARPRQVIDIRPPEDVFVDVDEGVEGLLEAWLVDENDRVAADQPVADAVVIKASFQVLSPAVGTIAKIVVPKGETFGACDPPGQARGRSLDRHLVCNV